MASLLDAAAVGAGAILGITLGSLGAQFVYRGSESSFRSTSEKVFARPRIEITSFLRHQKPLQESVRVALDTRIAKDAILPPGWILHTLYPMQPLPEQGPPVAISLWKYLDAVPRSDTTYVGGSSFSHSYRWLLYDISNALRRRAEGEKSIVKRLRGYVAPSRLTRSSKSPDLQQLTRVLLDILKTETHPKTIRYVVRVGAAVKRLTMFGATAPVVPPNGVSYSDYRYDLTPNPNAWATTETPSLVYRGMTADGSAALLGSGGLPMILESKATTCVRIDPSVWFDPEIIAIARELLPRAEWNYSFGPAGMMRRMPYCLLILLQPKSTVTLDRASFDSLRSIIEDRRALSAQDLGSDAISDGVVSSLSVVPSGDLVIATPADAMYIAGIISIPTDDGERSPTGGGVRR